MLTSVRHNQGTEFALIGTGVYFLWDSLRTPHWTAIIPRMIILLSHQPHKAIHRLLIHTDFILSQSLWFPHVEISHCLIGGGALIKTYIFNKINWVSLIFRTLRYCPRASVLDCLQCKHETYILPFKSFTLLNQVPHQQQCSHFPLSQTTCTKYIVEFTIWYIPSDYLQRKLDVITLFTRVRSKIKSLSMSYSSSSLSSCPQKVVIDPS